MAERSNRERGQRRKKGERPSVSGAIKTATEQPARTGISRRDILKGGAALLAAGGLVAVFGRSWFAGEEQEPSPTTWSAPKKIEPRNPPAPDMMPADREMEKFEPVVVIKQILAEYNSWLASLEKGSVAGTNGIAKFAEIYNRRVQSIKSDEPMLPLSLAEFNRTGNADLFFRQLEPLKKILEKNHFYFRAIPTLGQWKGEKFDYMAVLTGDIKSQQSKKIDRRGKKATYEHLVVAIPPGDSPADYHSAPSGFTALTYKEGNKTVVMQSESGYGQSAELIYETLKREPQTEKEEAVHKAFRATLKGNRKNDVRAIQELLMSTSLMHEEQHVLDGHLEEETTLTQETLPRWMITEMRGLLAPLTGSQPKVALENLFNWSISQDKLRRGVGGMTLRVLEDLSGKDAIDLFSGSDDFIRSFGERAMLISDMYYHRVIEGNKSPIDAESEAAYHELIDKLKAR